MINVSISKTCLLNVLMNRIRYWTKECVDLELFRDFFSDLIDKNYFEDNTDEEFDIIEFVDACWLNRCKIIEIDDSNKDEFNKIINMYDNKQYDISGECFEHIHGLYIAAVSDDRNFILLNIN